MTTAITVRTAESLAQRARALQRGTLVHRLLQSLPDIAAERRREARAGLSRPQRRWLDRGGTAGAGRRHAGPDCGCAFRAGVRARQPRRSLDRRAAGAAGRPAGAGIRADRPPGGHGKRGPDRRFQDQPRPAEPARTRRRGAMSASSRCTGRCWPSFIPSCRSAPRCFGPKRAELMEISAPALEAELASIISA